VRVHVRVCLRVCVCMCVYVCVCSMLFMPVRMRAFMCAASAHVRTFMHIRVSICTHAYTYVDTRIHTRVYICVCTHENVETLSNLRRKNKVTNDISTLNTSIEEHKRRRIIHTEDENFCRTGIHRYIAMYILSIHTYIYISIHICIYTCIYIYV